MNKNQSYGSFVVKEKAHLRSHNSLNTTTGFQPVLRETFSAVYTISFFSLS